MAKSKQKKINWKNEAEKAAEFVSEVLSEAHREVIQWHGPTNTWLAFDTRCPAWEPDGYREMLCDHLEGYGYEVRGSALSEDQDSIAVLFTFDPEGPDGDDIETARMALWDLWRDETELIIGKLPKKERKDQRERRNVQEVIEQRTAAARVERYVMERPSQWDRELEQAYRGR